MRLAESHHTIEAELGAPLTRLIAWMQFMAERGCQQCCQHEVSSHAFQAVAVRFTGFSNPFGSVTEREKNPKMGLDRHGFVISRSPVQARRVAPELIQNTNCSMMRRK